MREGERDLRQPLMSLACMVVDAPVSFFLTPFPDLRFGARGQLL
jgi:hypothetical protein